MLDQGLHVCEGAIACMYYIASHETNVALNRNVVGKIQLSGIQCKDNVFIFRSASFKISKPLAVFCCCICLKQTTTNFLSQRQFIVKELF